MVLFDIPEELELQMLLPAVNLLVELEKQMAGREQS
jgi:hypothetical protein